MGQCFPIMHNKTLDSIPQSHRTRRNLSRLQSKQHPAFKDCLQIPTHFCRQGGRGTENEWPYSVFFNSMTKLRLRPAPDMGSVDFQPSDWESSLEWSEVTFCLLHGEQGSTGCKNGSVGDPWFVLGKNTGCLSPPPPRCSCGKRL